MDEQDGQDFGPGQAAGLVAYFSLSLRGAERRGNLVEVEHTPANHHCYGTEIANPRIEYGVAMTD